jgi:hypothetical protein
MLESKTCTDICRSIMCPFENYYLKQCGVNVAVGPTVYLFIYYGIFNYAVSSLDYTAKDDSKH